MAAASAPRAPSEARHRPKLRVFRGDPAAPADPEPPTPCRNPACRRRGDSTHRGLCKPCWTDKETRKLFKPRCRRGNRFAHKDLPPDGAKAPLPPEATEAQPGTDRKRGVLIRRANHPDGPFQLFHPDDPAIRERSVVGGRRAMFLLQISLCIRGDS